MPNDKDAKTGSVRKNSVAVILFVIFVTIFSTSFYQDFISKNPNVPTSELTYSTECINVDNQCQVKLWVADTVEKQLKGLADRPQIASKEGMLFVFDKPDYKCFWMKDMQFDIDIIWLDKNRQIIKIDADVRRESYPDNFCQDGVAYVVELVAGQAKRLELHPGQTLEFN